MFFLSLRISENLATLLFVRSFSQEFLRVENGQLMRQFAFIEGGPIRSLLLLTFIKYVNNSLFSVIKERVLKVVVR